MVFVPGVTSGVISAALGSAAPLPVAIFWPLNQTSALLSAPITAKALTGRGPVGTVNCARKKRSPAGADSAAVELSQIQRACASAV